MLNNKFLAQTLTGNPQPARNVPVTFPERYIQVINSDVFGTFWKCYTIFYNINVGEEFTEVYSRL